MDDARRGRVEAGAAVGLGDRDAEQAELAELAEQRDVERAATRRAPSPAARRASARTGAPSGEAARALLTPCGALPYHSGDAMTRPGIDSLVARPAGRAGRESDRAIRQGRGLDPPRTRAARRGAASPHRFVATEPEGATIDRVREAIDDDGARVVIYMGGDGTFAEVAKGILASQHAADVAMGMLPTGTANDQGKSFGLDAGPGALERNVARDRGGLHGRLRRRPARDRARPQGDPSRSVLRFVLGRPRRREPRDPQPRSRARRPHPRPRHDLSRSARLHGRGRAALPRELRRRHEVRSRRGDRRQGASVPERCST